MSTLPKLIEQSVVELKSGNQNISDEHSPKIGKQTDPDFKSNQALVVSYHPVKIQIDRTKHFQVRVRKPKYFRMSANGQTEGLQIRKQPSPGGVLSPCKNSN